MFRLLWVQIAFFLLPLTTMASDLPVVPYVDVSRFMGTWYSIAAFPYFFEARCVATRARYTLRDDGRVDVLNRCRRDSLDGPEFKAEGIAWLEDDPSNAKLRVQFQWPFSAPYWIIYLDKDYQTAITANPNREYLWILSRTPHISERRYNALVERARRLGFDVSRLRRVLQN